MKCISFYNFQKGLRPQLFRYKAQIGIKRSGIKCSTELKKFVFEYSNFQKNHILKLKISMKKICKNAITQKQK